MSLDFCKGDERQFRVTRSGVGNLRPAGRMRPLNNSMKRLPEENNNMDEYYMYLAKVVGAARDNFLRPVVI